MFPLNDILGKTERIMGGKKIPSKETKKKPLRKLPYKTKSVCPECEELLPAIVYSKNNKVFIKRECKTHGVFDEIYWNSLKEFERAKKFETKGSCELKEKKKGLSNCPFDCGLCENHKTRTALTNIVLTNRCDLSCWYCFFYARENKPIYEPTIKQIDKMLTELKRQQPDTANAIQFTGGEPTLRKDLVKIVELTKKKGFEHIQLNTHGIGFIQNKGLAKRLAKAGVAIIYLSFDGVTPKTNPKNHYEIPRILEECRKAGLGVVLVPTLIQGVNTREIGAMIDFALNNIDVIRGINFQPISFVGRMPKALREKQRITIPDALKKIEEQTKGILKRKDFFAVPSISPITEYLSESMGMNAYTLETHFACGTASYLFLTNRKPLALPRFFKVKEFFSLLNEKALRIKKAPLLIKNQVSFIESLFLPLEMPKFIDFSKAPKDINFFSILLGFFFQHNYSALFEFHKKALFVGMMHFMDLYNYDQQRVERCQVHYIVPNGKLIPFCTFNVFPKKYRDKIQNKYSVSWKKWCKAHPKEDPAKKYIRDKEKLASEKIYSKTYSKKSFF